jgi:tetratricopeptide (TPR) repeat protein
MLSICAGLLLTGCDAPEPPPTAERTVAVPTQPVPTEPVAPEEAAAARAALQRGLQKYQSRQIEQALTDLEEATRLDPNNAEAFYWLGRIRVVPSSLEASYSRAIEAFQQALRLQPDLMGAYQGLGLAHYFLAQYDQAKRVFLTFLQNPGEAVDDLMLAESHHFVGAIFNNEGDSKQALDHLEKATQLNPSFADTPYQMGLAYADLDQPEHAMEALLRATALAPSHLHAHFRLSRLYRQIGDREQAGRHQEIHRLLNELTDNISRKFSQDMATRLRLLTELTTLYPENFTARFQHAQLLLENRRAPEAAMLLDALIHDHPAFADAYVLSSRLALRMGQRNKAVQLLGKLQEQHPERTAATLPPDLRSLVQQ